MIKWLVISLALVCSLTFATEIYHNLKKTQMSACAAQISLQYNIGLKPLHDHCTWLGRPL